MKRTFGRKIVLTEKMPMIRGKYYQGLFGESQFIQFIKYFSDIFIHETDHTIINGQVFRFYVFIN